MKDHYPKKHLYNWERSVSGGFIKKGPFYQEWSVSEYKNGQAVLFRQSL